MFIIKQNAYTQLDTKKQVIAFQERVTTITTLDKGSSTPTKMRKIKIKVGLCINRNVR